MNKKFILALMLASGMAFAQTGGSGSTPDQSSQPSQQPSTTSSIHFALNDRSDEFKHRDQQPARGSIQFHAGLPETVRRELGARF